MLTRLFGIQQSFSSAHTARALCRLSFFCVFFLTALFFLFPNTLQAEVREFREFRITLPEGWDGGEKSGFSSGDRNEYMLVLGKKDSAGERYLAHITLFFLPNKPGKDAHESAKTLAKSQADSTEPVKDGLFWVFTGDPRDNILKGKGTTRVAADRENLLIIIIKDPENTHAEDILKTLTPLSERAKKLLVQEDGN